MEGKDIVALGAIFQESPLMLLTRDDTNINSIEDLKNKRIMLTKDAKGTASIMAMLFSKGLNQKDIQILPHSFNLDDLINKNTDAIASYISNEPIVMADRGIGYKIFYPKDYGFHFYSDILFSSSEFINNNPKLTKRFYEASIKGWEYAFDNIAQTAELIYKNYNTQHKTLIQLVKEGEALKKLAYPKNGIIGYLDKNQLYDIVKVYQLLGLITKDIDIDSFIYEYNHPKEVAFKLNYDEIFHISLVLAVVIISFGFGILFIIFRKKLLLTKSYLKEEIALQKEKIEKQNRVILVQSKIAAMGEMISNIAHQWRQPLNVISLSVAKIETSLLLGNEMKNEDFLKISGEINIQAQYLSQTIDDFRNYFNSNIDNITSFNIEDSIIKVNELVKETFKTNHIEIVMNSEKCTLTHNETLLIQSLVNIYNNAKDAIIESEVLYKYFFIDIKCNIDNVIITLKDSGGGIGEDSIEKVFEPYFTNKHKTKGTGLGLYITYGIVTEHLSGTVTVRNTDYIYRNHKLSGAEFTIAIPRISTYS
jgi:signal transduction histidine kinase